MRLAAGERADLLERYAVEAYLAGASAEGLEARRAALAEWERLDDRVRIGQNLRWISRLEWWSGHGATARGAAARAVEVLAAGEPGRELAMAYSNRSQLHMLADELPAAIEWGERARVLADSLGDLDTSVHAAINVSAARILGGDESVVTALRSTYATAAAAGLVDHAARALVCVVAGLAQTWRDGAAAPAADEALEYAEAHDLDGYAQHLLGLRAQIRLEQCDWDAALADADDALGRPGRRGIAMVSALVARGRILAARGSDEALSILDLAAELAYGTEELQRIGPVAAARAEYFLLVGEPGRASDEAEPVLALAAGKGMRWVADELAYLVWRATGRDELPVVEVLVANSSTVDPSPYRLLMAGDWAAAARAWADRGRRFARLEALSTGDSAAVAEALGGLDEIGAVRRAQQLRADLRRQGVSNVPRGPRAATTANAAGLTPRQLEILTLLADGLSNADIAERLTLSHRTVEHHISALLAKLGVARRGQAVATARRLDVLP